MALFAGAVVFAGAVLPAGAMLFALRWRRCFFAAGLVELVAVPGLAFVVAVTGVVADFCAGVAAGFCEGAEEVVLAIGVAVEGAVFAVDTLDGAAFV